MGSAPHSCTNGRILGVLAATIVFSACLSAQSQPFKLETATGSGLLVLTFQTPVGKIRVNLPDELHPGEAFSGSVVAVDPRSSVIRAYSRA